MATSCQFWEIELSIEMWCLISHIWVEGELSPFPYLSWGWVITVSIFELRVKYHHYIWGLFESRWAIPIELSILSLSWVHWVYFELWVILLNCWLLKFFLLYVLWDLWVIPWDSDIAPRVSLDGVPIDPYIKSIDVH